MRRFIRAWAMTIAVLWPICVSAEVRDNDRVAHKIHDVLKTSGQMSGSSFVIKCQDGTACLEGRVNSEEQKALALKLTGEVAEIDEVIDHLRVEPAKKPNPVVRLLSTPFTKPAAEPQELPEEAGSEKAPRSFSTWFKNPAVHVAKAPRVKAPEAAPAALAADEIAEVSADEGSVYPEALEHSHPAEPGNLLVRQVANLRSMFKHNEPAKAAPVAVSRPAPQKNARSSGQCAACEGRVQSTTMPKMTQVANTTRYRAVSPAPGASQSGQTAGRVRMVPMIELADGSLVPVEQGRRTPTATTPSNSGQRVNTASRTRLMPNSRSRQSVARKQEIIEGPMDGEPAAPMPVMRGPAGGGPLPSYVPGTAVGVAPAYYDQPHMPNYAWPSYAAHPNYAGLTYPRQYSPTAWPYIGPFYPYPQVPLGWRKVTLEWDDGWWFLDFDDTNRSYAY
jgi:hypothetical protein